MTVSAEQRTANPPGAGAFVRSVEDAIEAWLAREARHTEGSEHVLVDAARHLASAPAAKRARATLVYFFGQAASVEPAALRDLAVAAELVHTASLLHDDVIDGGEERRGRATVNAAWNNPTAVLTGDAMLCRALIALRGHPDRVTSTAVDVVAEMTRGLMHEARARGDPRAGRPDWNRVAEAKTASLFGWCGLAPAIVGGERAAPRFQRAGHHLGMAFQLADDLRDVVDREGGKDAYADIRNGDLSHPLVCAAEGSSEVATSLEALWSRAADAPEPVEIARMIRRTHATSETRNRLAEEVSQANEALGAFADRDGGRQIARWGRRLVETVDGWLEAPVPPGHAEAGDDE